MPRNSTSNVWMLWGIIKGSDIDLLADFPIEVAWPAMTAAESVCADAGLPCDVIEKRTCTDEFLAIVFPDIKAIR